MRREDLSIAAIRALCIDEIEKAKSGHPGMALGSAPILYTLFTKHLVQDPSHPDWIARDRFVLSAGHASALLYAMLHIAGYPLTMDDLKQFRQLDSKTPGHPEYRHTIGVDATSGPLGQGIAQAVGMALAETSLTSMYKDGDKIFNHYTYCLCGDGCLQEGISQEAISFAGHQKLNKLILFYDANSVTLDGPLSQSFSEDIKARFNAAGWNMIEVRNGNNVNSINRAIKKAKKSDRPTIIKINTIIGYGSENQGTCKVHGAPLSAEDAKNAKQKYHYDYPDFTVPEEVYNHFRRTFIKRGENAYQNWKKEYDSFSFYNREQASKIESTLRNDVSTYIFDQNPYFEIGFKDSTRNLSQTILNVVNKSVFNLVGGSADVAKSVMTSIEGETNYGPYNRKGRNICFGIREFAMASIQNGMLLHGGLRTYIGCFLVFSDYMKAAIRMAALSKLPAIYLFSHDSIAVGEDGPTHQPIEQLAMLRSIPNCEVYRPCDANELSVAWKEALKSTDHPTCLILSRQSLPVLPNTREGASDRGAYILSKERGQKPQLTIIATGSEVSLAFEAQQMLWKRGYDIRVVSMPCQERFLKQDNQYIEETLGAPYAQRIAVEMLSSYGWHRFSPHVMSIDTFGKSAPAKDVINDFDFTVEELIRRIKEIV